MAKVDLAPLNALVEERYLSVQRHPSADLLIYNYTQKTQFEQHWNEYTLMCRGLIVRPDGTIVARPFKKFFNLEQHQGEIPLEPFTVTGKEDGSLGMLYFVENEPYIATRGSFTSEQAIRANSLLQERFGALRYLFKPENTYLFEIIYPANRIVVDYGSREDLILLAIIDTETGKEYDIRDIPQWGPLSVVKHYTDITSLRALEESNKEGFVIRFESGLRLKVKFAEYIRLHRLLTQVNARVIWDLQRNNQSFDDLLERVPDEFYSWVIVTRNTLIKQYSTIEAHCRSVAYSVQHLPTRKEQAAIVCKEQYSGIIFSMLDQKNYQDALWRLLRPEAERPFREDEA